MPVVELDGRPLGDGRPGPAAVGAPGGSSPGRGRVSIHVLHLRRAARPLGANRSDQVTDVWPEYNEQGDVLDEHWSRLDEDFPSSSSSSTTRSADAALAHGHSIPCALGRHGRGPAGRDRRARSSTRVGSATRAASRTTLSALAIEIPPAHQGGGLSRTMIGAHARHRSATTASPDLIAPLRPTWKERYPLTPIERYASWTRDGRAPVRPLDPPARPPRRGDRPADTAVAPDHGHRGRLGGVDRRCRSRRAATYVFPHGLAPLDVDREPDRGEYWEPNVWVHHRVG